MPEPMSVWFNVKEGVFQMSELMPFCFSFS